MSHDPQKKSQFLAQKFKQDLLFFTAEKNHVFCRENTN